MALDNVSCPHCKLLLRVEGDEIVCGRCTSRIILKDGKYSHYLPGNTPECAAEKVKELRSGLGGGVGVGETKAGDPATTAGLDSGAAATALPPEAPGLVLDAPATADREVRTETFSFRFTGSAKEYFGIWIVNTLLRIVTVGIYSPWAKVRRRRYFYTNTLLDDAPFDYLADPLAILKGWLIAAAFLVAYSVCNRSYPTVAPLIALVFSGVYPWILVRSRMFNCFNTTYRNIRFRFTPDYRGAYREFLWLPLLCIPTLGLLFPYVVWRQRRFLVENTFIGAASFTFDASPRAFYRIFAPLLLALPVLIACFAWIAIAAKNHTAANPALAIVLLGLFPLVYFLALIYIPTAVANVTWSGTVLGPLRFSLKMKVREVTWLYLSNAVAIVITLGLMAPWAAVRMASYRFERMGVSGAGGLDAIAAGAPQEVGAAGEEIGDFFGFDFGL